MKKELCQKCYKKNGTNWIPGDEQRWKRGEIDCAVRNWGTYPIVDGPPRGCPLALEHIVLSQEEK